MTRARRRLFATFATFAALSASGAAADEPSAPIGRVVAVRTDGCVVSLGASDGLAVGDRVEVFVLEENELGDTPAARIEHTVAIGVVVGLANDRSRVRVGVDERVRAGAFARRTDERTTDHLARRPRTSEVVTLEATLRPFLPFETGDLGTVADFAVGYRGARAWFVRARSAPVGFVTSTGRAEWVAAGHVLAGYDHRGFDVGFGLGVARAYRDGAAGGVAPALTLAQTARFGSVDGLHLQVENLIALVRDPVDGRRKYDWARTDLRLQLPVMARLWLVSRLGIGARTGAFVADAGLRALVFGNGLRGTVFLTFGAGYVRIDRAGPDGSQDDLAGPAALLGIETRL